MKNNVQRKKKLSYHCVAVTGSLKEKKMSIKISETWFYHATRQKAKDSYKGNSGKKRMQQIISIF